MSSDTASVLVFLSQESGVSVEEEEEEEEEEDAQPSTSAQIPGKIGKLI